MKEILEAYADLRSERDKLLADNTALTGDLRTLLGAVQGKVKITNDVRVVDLAIGYIKQLENRHGHMDDLLAEETMAPINGSAN